MRAFSSLTRSERKKSAASPLSSIFDSNRGSSSIDVCLKAYGHRAPTGSLKQRVKTRTPFRSIATAKAQSRGAPANVTRAGSRTREFIFGASGAWPAIAWSRTCGQRPEGQPDGAVRLLRRGARRPHHFVRFFSAAMRTMTFANCMDTRTTARLYELSIAS